MGQGWANGRGRHGLQIKKILEKKRGVPTWKKLHRPRKGRLHPMGATKPHGYADGQCHWVQRWITANFSHSRSPMEAPMKLLHINASTRGENRESLKMDTTFIEELRKHTQSG